MIAFRCSRCGKSLQIRDELAGQQARCVACGQVGPVPAPARASLTPPSAATVPPSVSEPPSPVPTEESASDRAAAPAGHDNTVSNSRPAAPAEDWDFLAPAQAADEMGRLGPYRIRRVLGTGGMGVVFLAEDPQLERPVALKTLKPVLAASDAAKRRFTREARAMAKVKHDHIVVIHQVGEDRGVPFLAMELLEGESLQERLGREGRLPFTEVVRIGHELALGLAAAHARGLIHRDIKPGNVWLEGERGRVKLLDFGLARATDDDARVTQSGAFVGTPAYMAPEQAHGEEVDARCDLFSLGSVLYRLCTGVLPFSGKDATSVLLALALEQPKPPRQLNAQVPAPLSELIMQLLAKDRTQRPVSAQAVAAALAKIAIEPPHTETPLVGAPRRRDMRGGRRLWALGAAAAVLLAVVVAGAIYYWPSNDEGGAAQGPPVPAPQAIKDEEWVKAVAAMTAEEQVAAVVMKLQERNPDFDGKLTHKNIVGGVVTELGFLSEHVLDLSPVRALVGLQRLDTTAGYLRASKLADLRALAGARLTSLDVSGASVAELSPLRGMRLTRLDCGGTRVSTLEELRGMPLVWLSCGRTLVTDLSPVKEAPLTDLDISDCKVKDLTALKGMLLNSLNMGGTPVDDLTPLIDAPLLNLRCQYTPVSDLSPLRAMRLVYVECHDTRVATLEALRGMPLHLLSCGGTQVKDLSPLRDAPLAKFACDRTAVSDLAPLKGRPLTDLLISETRVTDLSPLEGMPLTRLRMHGLALTSLTPLRGLPLKEIELDYQPKRDREILHSLKSLEVINGKPLAEFWKDVAGK
jgi:eukaryotic-like serine/threonine-protein kinase